MMQRPLSGIVPPVITPLVGRDELDGEGFERLLERLIAGGVQGLFVLGTTGEGPSLSYRLRREVVERACRVAAGRVPVLVGITDTAFVESVALAQFSAEAGADAVVAAPPYYLPEGQPELIEYVDHLLAELSLPFFLYNMPALTKVSFELDTVAALMDRPGIHGIKDSSGNMTYFHKLLRLARGREDWSLLMGPEELLLDTVLAGGHGGVNGGANVFPELYVALHAAAAAGDLVRARRLHEVVIDLSSQLYQVGRHPSAIIKGIKCALALQGVCHDFMAEPFHRFRDAERQRIADLIPRLQQQIDLALA